MKIVVLSGGISPERDVSLSSGCMIANALAEKGHEVVMVDSFLGIEKPEEGLGSLFKKLPEYQPKTLGVPSEPLQIPSFTDDREDPYRFSAANDTGVFGHIAVPIPQGAIKKGTNVIAITLQEGSWLFYDYLALRKKPEPIKPQSLLNEFKDDLGGADKIVFAVRKPGLDPHWYANFGYYPTFDPEDRPFKPHDGGELRVLDLATGKTETLIRDEKGSFRDPTVSYDGKKILFSYLKEGTEHYNLYEIGIDGKNLRQLTFGDDDDIEPC